MKNNQEEVAVEKKSFKEKLVEKKDNAKRKWDNFQLFLAFLGAIFFGVSLVSSLKKSDVQNSAFFPFIVGLTIVYLVVFVIFLLVHRKNKDNIKNDTKNFKSIANIVKLAMNLIFVATSLLIFLESLQGMSADAGFFVRFKTFIAGAFVVIKLITTCSKLVKNIKKREKLKQKQQQAKQKQLEQQK